MLDVQVVNRVIRNIVLGSDGKYGRTNPSLATGIKRLYFQFTRVELTEKQSSFIDNLGNKIATEVYKALMNLEVLSDEDDEIVF